MLQKLQLPKSSSFLRSIHRTISEFGFNPRALFSSSAGIPLYLYQVIQFQQKNPYSESRIAISGLLPCLGDRYQGDSHIDKHYFYQDLWAARKVYQNCPDKHLDVGSRIDGFVAHILTFRSIDILDVRPINSKIDGMNYRQADLMKSEELPINQYDSVSCLHALEHFGLGRYGDPVDPDGHIKGLQSLNMLLQPNGKLLLSVPIGQERIEFNAHRIFSVHTILNLTQPFLDLVSFSYIDDDGIFHENVDTQDTPTMTYGCGLFEFRKKSIN